MTSTADDVLHTVLLILRQRFIRISFKQLAETKNRIHRCAQLMAHRRQEIGLGPVGVIGDVAGLQQVGLGLLADCHITDHAEHVGRNAVFVAHGIAALVQPANCAVEPDDTVFNVVVRIFLDASRDRPGHFLPIIGVNGFDEVVIGRFKTSRRATEQDSNVVRPVQRTGLDVPVPSADAGEGLTFSKARFGFTEGEFGVFSLCDVAHDTDEHRLSQAGHGGDVQLEGEQTSVFAQPL